MTATLSPELRRRRAELIERVQYRDGVSEVFTQASSRLRRLIPFDSALWVAADPATGLPVAPSRLENVAEGEPDECIAFWRREYELSDVNHFRALSEADVPAATLRQAAGEPFHSARFRDFLEPQGIDDELRLVLRSGGHPWGLVSLWRRRGRTSFTGEDTALAASLSAPLADTLRRHARPAGKPELAGPDRPGLLLFDPDGWPTSVNEEAIAWLDELPPEPAVRSDLGIEVPLWMFATVFRARGAGADDLSMAARARVRTRRRIWLICHCSVLRDASDAVTGIALTIEPAKAAEVAPIVVQAYDLSEREQQITRLIARGAGTGHIADRLYVSPHTVRDHVKAIFQKVGVSSRGELVATLFADHYWPQHDREVVRVDD